MYFLCVALVVRTVNPIGNMHIMIYRVGQVLFRASCLALIVFSTATCKKDQVDAGPEGVVEEAVVAVELLIFPKSVHVEDPSVNAFVQRAMTVCGSGDYGEFRSLWSAREEPLSRGEYQKGWQAVREIKIRLLNQVHLAGDDDDADMPLGQGYVMLADVHFDSEADADGHGSRRAVILPDREVILLIVSEREEWRLVRAPRTLRDWVRKRIEEQATAAVDAKKQPIGNGEQANKDRNSKTPSP